MRVTKPKSLTEQGRRLLAAGDAAEQEAHRDPSVAPCAPLSSQTAAFRVLAWHIDGLGGDLATPTVHDESVIDAYATLIAEVQPDIVLIRGVQRSFERPVVLDELPDGSSYARLDEAIDHQGSAEVDRILAVLARRDLAAGWTAALPRVPGTPDEIAYDTAQTVAFVYAASRPVELLKMEVDEVAGSVWAHFVRPAASRCALPLGATLATSGASLAATSKIGGAHVMAISSARDLSAHRAAIGGEYEELANQGTVLSPPLWGSIARAHPNLLRNFLALCPGDVRYQDENMHWEAMTSAPAHPSNLDAVTGERRDLLVLLHRGSDTRARVVESRIIDLVRAALPCAALKAAYRDSRHSQDCTPEDSCLAARYRAHTAGLAHFPGSTLPHEEDAIRNISEAKAFARHLCTHWPVLAELEIRSPG